MTIGRAVVSLAAFLLGLSGPAAWADGWQLYVPPPPFGQTPLPPYSQWQYYAGYDTVDECQDATHALHFELWDQDQDLAGRMLHSICYDPETDEIVE